jgi:diguanylate cyclase (GGDEF)-like protein
MALSLLILVLLVALWYVWLKDMADMSLLALKARLRIAEGELASLTLKDSLQRTANADLQARLEQTIALCDLTKQICKSLEEEKVFMYFRDQIDKYIELQDCKFLKPQVDLAAFGGYEILPLHINNRVIGYLAATGISDAQRYKFHILAHQFWLGIKRALLYKKVQELAISDTLTGTFTRRYYLERLHEEIERSKKFKYSSSFLMIDIDFFKKYNDQYGHLVGDAVLKEIAGTIKDNIRQVDSVGRFGGEEFLVILTETDKNGARFAAERIRQAIETKRLRVYDEDLKLTVSIGVATFAEDAQDTNALIDKADKALYRAKQAGRNRVCVHGIYR